MHQIWIVLVVGIAAAAAAVPLAAIVLVTVASHREESAHTLGGQAPGPATRAARRLLGFRAERITRLVPDRLAPGPLREPELEVRFAHARRSLSDTGQYPARRQPQPSPIRTDQRQGAGV